jgi:hypothetical protein
VAPPKPNVGVISAVISAGKSRESVDGSLRPKGQLRSDALLADPIVYALDEGTLSRYERRVLISSAAIHPLDAIWIFLIRNSLQSPSERLVE